MTTLEDFHQTISDDYRGWLVLADWLDEQGDQRGAEARCFERHSDVQAVGRITLAEDHLPRRNGLLFGDHGYLAKTFLFYVGKIGVPSKLLG